MNTSSGNGGITSNGENASNSENVGNGGNAGKAADSIAMSSRLRLARNFSGFPFPGRLDGDAARKILDMAKTAVFSSEGINSSDYLYVDMQKLDPIDRTMLVEKHLASPELASQNKPCAAIISKDESVSIMLIEEDHLRIQCIARSATIEEALEKCEAVERVFEGSFDMAFDPNLGYLTSCPTNLGTGMRASYMLHLPALVVTGHISAIIEQCGRIGVAVRGIYGENSVASGNMFQFSNQGSLGRNETEILTNIKNVSMQIIDHEFKLRNELYDKNKSRFEDRVWRAMGTMQSARILTTEEFMELWSGVRVGVDMGIIENIGAAMLDDLMTQSQPASLQKMAGRSLTTEERDTHRADLVRGKIAAHGK